MAAQPAPTKRIQGRELQRIRKRRLQDDPLCVRCKKNGRISLAEEIDHIVCLHKGGAEEDSNRQNLCKECHRIKTAEDRGWNPAPTIGIDGWPVDNPRPTSRQPQSNVTRMPTRPRQDYTGTQLAPAHSARAVKKLTKYG